MSGGFQEYVAAILAALLVLGVVVIAVLQSLGIAKAPPPDYLQVMASAAVAFYFGQKFIAGKLNGNVTALASATQQLANAATASNAATAAGAAASVKQQSSLSV